MQTEETRFLNYAEVHSLSSQQQLSLKLNLLDHEDNHVEYAMLTCAHNANEDKGSTSQTERGISIIPSIFFFQKGNRILSRNKLAIAVIISMFSTVLTTITIIIEHAHCLQLAYFIHEELVCLFDNNTTFLWWSCPFQYTQSLMCNWDSFKISTS